MRPRRWQHLAVVVVALAALVVPAFVMAGDEMPIERDEIPKVSGSLSHIVGAVGGGVGGGAISNSTCTSSGNPAANIKLN